MRYSTYVGIDTHAKKNAVCAIVEQTGEVREATFGADPAKIADWIRENDFPQPVGCVYESGPTGFGLARALIAEGIPCTVAATSKLSYRADAVKTDARDARWLAGLLKGGGVRACRIPTPHEEALCRLSRLRGEVAADLRRAKQRVSSFLLVTGTKYTLTKKRWTKTFVKWAQSVELDDPVNTFTLREKVGAALRLAERLERVEAEILRLVEADPELSERMARLLCVHGIGKVSAFSLVCEVYDFERFRNGAAFADFLGLAPGVRATDRHVRRGPITKQGNSHLRRILVEAAGCYSRPFRPCRSEDPRVPEAVRAHAEKCARRLRKRRLDLAARKVKGNKAKVAVARELAEWVYHIATMPA